MPNDSTSLVNVTAYDRQDAGAGGRGGGAHAIPAEPLVVIQPSSSRAPLNLGELWASRELLYFLVWRDLKIRYKQTALGMAWVVFQPLLMTVVFTLVLGRVVRIPSENVPYLLFAYAGLMLWTFFSGAVSVTGNCLVGNAHIVTKVYFPRLVIPLASIAARFVDLGVAFTVLAGLMAFYGIAPTARSLLALVLVVLLSLLALGFGMWTSAVNVRYRDVGLMLPVLIQLWMYATPVVYPVSMVPERWRLAYSLNPLVGIVEGFRAALFGGEFNWPALAISTSVTLALLVYAAYAFRRREKTFADII